MRAPFDDAWHEDLAEEREAFNFDDDDFDLFHAAALLPRVGGREPDLAALDLEVDRLAILVEESANEQPAWPGPLRALRETLFAGAGFQGDSEHYDDPENSFLDAVVSRRQGLPISLSVLTCEVARRAGVESYGIAFPGHFLVGVQDAPPGGVAELVVIDPFHKGAVLTPDTLERQLSRLAGRPVELLPEHLMPATPRSILLRMLVNLRGSYARRNDAVGMFRVLSRVLVLAPNNPEALAERALVRRDLLDLDGAREDAEAALRAAPDKEDAAAVRARRVLRRLEADRRWAH
jgi:regulator of sirC expression with transglutaminase-like and TPR domain